VWRIVRLGVAAERQEAASANRRAKIARGKRRMIFSFVVPGVDITALPFGQCNETCANSLH
jgi:hypothetical protein